MADNSIMPVMDVGTGAGSGSFMWIFGLIVLLALFNGGGLFGGNSAAAALGYENLATSSEVQNGFNAQNSMAFDRDILAAINNGTAQSVAATNAGTASLIREFGTVESALTALSGKQQECCGNVLRAVDAVNYNSAINTAAINANVTAQVQSIKDMLYAQKEQAQAARIQSLELAQAMNGVLRYPNGWTYNAGPFPPVVSTAAAGA